MAAADADDLNQFDIRYFKDMWSEFNRNDLSKDLNMKLILPFFQSHRLIDDNQAYLLDREVPSEQRRLFFTAFLPLTGQRGLDVMLDICKDNNWQPCRGHLMKKKNEYVEEKVEFNKKFVPKK